MAMIGYFNSVEGDDGKPKQATITVYLAGTATKATIYTTAAGDVEKGNPFQTDVLGRFQFFAAAGAYDIQVSGTGITIYKIEYEQLSNITKTTELTDMPASLVGQAKKLIKVKNTEDGYEHFEQGWEDVRNYASFSAAIDAIGAAEKTLLIPNEQAVSADKTVPLNVTLKFLQGGSLNIATTKTVTINGHVEAGLYQIFKWTGTGKVVFGAGAVKEVYPEWWGAVPDNATDCYAALQAALNAANDMAGGIVQLSAGVYKKSAPLIIYDYTHLLGVGYNTSIINSDDNENGINLNSNARWVRIRDLNLVGTVTFSTNSAIYIDPIGGAAQCKFENIYISKFAYGLNTGDLFWDNILRNVRVDAAIVSFYVVSSSGNSINNLFDKCYSEAASTGAFRFSGVSTAVILNCNIGGSATNDYLIYLLTNCQVSIIGTNFENATLALSAAVIKIISGSVVNIFGCKFMSITGPGGSDYATLIQGKETSKTTVFNCIEQNTSGNMYSIQVYNTAIIDLFNNLLLSSYNYVSATTSEAKIYTLDGVRTARTAVSVDLSGAAATLVCFHSEKAGHIIKATLLYTEASSADAGITIEIGKESDRDYYYTGTTEINKSIWYSLDVARLKTNFDAGDTLTLYSPGNKIGTGEIMLIIEYVPED